MALTSKIGTTPSPIIVGPTVPIFTSTPWFGTIGNDTRTGGNSSNDIMYGLGGNDTLNGRGGNDTLSGGDGNDTLLGGTGNDVLDGGTGDDLLDGGQGADAMSGGAGNDTYVVDNVGDVVSETFVSGGQVYDYGGEDWVNTSLSEYTLPENVENVTYTGTGSFTGTGNDADNHMNLLTGNVGPVTFYGLGGDDDINSGDGDDFLYGGDGDDEIYGGDGNDYIEGGSGNDEVIGSGGNDTLFGGDGNDEMIGGTGSDAMYGGTGDDTYYVDDANDTVIEDDTAAPTGWFGDTVVTTLNAYGLTDNVENLVYDGTGGFTGAGNEQANLIIARQTSESVNLYGMGGDDIIVGNTGGDWIEGGDGNDRLIGREGDDWTIGGAGADTFVFGSSDGYDVISDFNRAEGDTIELNGASITSIVNDFNGNAVIYAGRTAITLNGVDASQIDSSYFSGNEPAMAQGFAAAGYGVDAGVNDYQLANTYHAAQFMDFNW
jgi:Ca2+-binding RTX toxin-like protein